ncbi:hypothetical protein AMTRI_Chr01g128630 [Amborella trichopoda]
MLVHGRVPYNERIMLSIKMSHRRRKTSSFLLSQRTHHILFKQPLRSINFNHLLCQVVCISSAYLLHFLCNDCFSFYVNYLLLLVTSFSLSFSLLLDRHHTNPVGKSWQWKLDDPLEIVNAAIDEHTETIKQMKGVPGVTTDRLFEGLSPRHCALSLVGEPIMYPEINALIDELHKQRISTFLLTNAQFPERIRLLKPITQDSLRALREKEQRTVYHLTLVKGWNAEDIDAYYELFSIGKPDFVEIKGVTYCGSSATSKLTMENVPWYLDVKAFSEVLASKSGSEYEIASEHTHSCCVLLARADKFRVNGQWFTWIDYERFHDLDYMAATPSWAVYGAEEGGFDPDQARYKKERRHGSCNGQNRQPVS